MPAHTARKINRLIFAVFVAASAFALWKALAPGDDTTGLIPWDKAKHFIVFYVLSILASMALPKSRLWRVGLVLLAFGGAIELLQALPFIHRDCSWLDLLADGVAICSAYGPMILARWRQGESVTTLIATELNGQADQGASA